MDEFSITRPEPATPTRDSGGHASPGRETKERRRPAKAPEPANPDTPEPPGDDEVSHQVDELA